MSYFELTLFLYIALAFVKFMVSLPGIYLAARVMAKHSDSGYSVAYFSMMVLLVLIATVVFMWPRMLKAEGWHFFDIPTNRQVIRQVLNGCKEASASNA